MTTTSTIFNLQDKKFILTGSNGQLGQATSELLTSLGATIIGCDTQNRKDKQSHYYQLDIAKKSNVVETFSNIFNEYNTIDGLINNAGVSTFQPFEERSDENFDWVMDVNLKGTFNCIQSYYNLYKKAPCASGSIVNIGSIYGLVSPDFRIYTDCDRKNSEVYGATKAGIIQMTKYFSVHLAKDNIRVNAISPGGIFNNKSPQGKDFVKNYSDRCPMGRMANANEIVGGIAYFLSDSSSYTTGQNIAIDGGFTSW